MTPAELSRTVLRSVRGAVEDRELSVPVPARIVVRPPKRPGSGDYASSVALQLAGPAGRPAREVAEILRKRLAGSPGIDRVEIAGPGFLNFTLGDGAPADLVRQILTQGAAYGTHATPYGTHATPYGTHATAHGTDAFVASPSSSATCPSGAVDHYRVYGSGGARDTVVAEALARIDAAVGASGVHSPLQPRPGEPGSAYEPDELAVLVARLGSDEARWVLLRPAAHDPVRVPERPVQREGNPRFLVQYAYARVRALVRNADDLGFASRPGQVEGNEPTPGPANPAARPAALPDLLRDLHTLLATYPSALEVAARLRAPDRVVRHLEATAEAFFRWHDVCPPLPVGEQKPLAVHRARLALAEAVGTVLANGLRLLGISAPEHL
ncbi:ArgS-related anticodon-binding protein NrtL [Streptomyces endophytica]|uniref:arginine--tRNA ligase n=1 Tax=Streptomyces endophytica TaxID=2991496 RepID=A0ABY6P737_9ACTN|nr:DALR anticodon-binding domain-containing protein [Streptomyces endophytica]UZJ29609.1 DALR anticodon-binding domain-containing protein [Streptomyces endophytica]